MDSKKIQDLEDIRVVCIVGDANPELKMDLAGTSVRARAERLRYLAGLGLTLGRTKTQQGSVWVDAPKSVQPATGITAESNALPKKPSASKEGVKSMTSHDELLSAQNQSVVAENSSPSTEEKGKEGKSEAASAITAHPSLSNFARSLIR